jgi:hypothetical protein
MMKQRAHFYEKSLCMCCKYSYRDGDRYLNCSSVLRSNRKIPKDVLSGDRGCPEFRARQI